jgi:tight adherence protein B
MRTRRPLAAIAATAAAVLAVPAPVAADEPGQITSIATADDQITLTFSAAELGPDTAVDPDSVQVSLNGEPAQAVAEPVSQSDTAPTRRVILTMDASGSMAEDGRIEAARSAATSFVDQLPDGVEVGLVSFAETAQLVVEPTTDRARVRDAVSALQPAGDTALYDGLLVALDAAGDDGARSVITLSDGADTISQAPLQDVIDAATAADGVQVDAIALGPNVDEALGSLTQVASATGGTVVAAGESGQLAALFDDAASALANEVLVTVTVPREITGTDTTVTVSATAAGRALLAEAYVSLDPASAPTEATAADYGPTAAPQTPEVPRWVMLAGAAGIAVGLTGLLLSVMIKSRGGRSDQLRANLAGYTLAAESEPHNPTDARPSRRGLTESARMAADRLAQARGFDDDLGRRLDAAALPLRPGEWMMLHTGIAIGGGLALGLLSGFRMLLALLGVAVGLVAPFLYLKVKADRRRARFAEHLSDTLQLLAGSLAAGHSLVQAVDTAGHESADPISREFNRAMVESRLGVDIEDALTDVADRMRSQDFLWVVMAIRIQRKVGGNLAELMTTVAATLRERQQLRRQVRVLSAEGRLSAWILGLLPVAFAGYLFVSNPAYLATLYTNPLGIAMLITALVLMAVGAVWLKKTVDVEV